MLIWNTENKGGPVLSSFLSPVSAIELVYIYMPLCFHFSKDVYIIKTEIDVQTQTFVGLEHSRLPYKTNLC